MKQHSTNIFFCTVVNCLTKYQINAIYIIYIIRNSIRNFEAEILWKNKELQARSQVKVPYKKKTCS